MIVFIMVPMRGSSPYCLVPMEPVAGAQLPMRQAPRSLWDLYNYLHTCMHVLTSFFFRTFHTTGLAFARHDSMMINMSKSSIQLAFIPWRALLIKHQQHMNQKDTASFHGSCATTVPLPCGFHCLTLRQPQWIRTEMPLFSIFRIEHQWLHG